MKHLTKFANVTAYNDAVDTQTIDCPNVSLIEDTGAVKFLKSNPPIGVGIKSVDGGYYTLEEWQALETKPTALGVYVKQGSEVGFIIHGTIQGAAWSNNTSVLVDGVTTTTDQATALFDFKGTANTNAVLNAVALGTIEDAPLFTWANQLEWADGSNGGYVPAMGELNLIKNNLALVNGCRTAIGQSEIKFEDSYLWTSTQANTLGAWRWGSTYWDYYGKYYNYLVGLSLRAL